MKEAEGASAAAARALPAMHQGFRSHAEPGK